jgi:ubiquinone/menaquinone biosynthesis C-methylase UbiE
MQFLSHVKAGDVILDIGCGSESVIQEYDKKIEIDILPQNKPNVVGNAINIPLKNLSVHHICCSWVYEHIEEPIRSLEEFNRILKPNGYIYLTTNFAWHLHEEPRDFYRFTKYGLRYLFNSYGKWQIVFLEPTAGFWTTIFQLFNYKLAKTFGPLHPFFTLPLQFLSLFLERLDFDASLAAGYCLIAHKVQ